MRNTPITLGKSGLALVAAILAVGAGAQAQPKPLTLEEVAAENAALRQRLEALEAAQPEASRDAGGWSKTLSFLSESSLSGFVTASYFHDFSDPSDGESNGYLWNRNHNEFTLNKIKLVLERPATRGGDEWSAGYHVSAIFGKDAPITNTGGEQQGLEEIRQAFFELNIPVGTGLNFKAGQLISLLNFESGDGGAANPNFSQGNQWFFTGNGPSTGVQLSYAVNDKVDITGRVQNGLYAGAGDVDNSKMFMGSIRVKPTDMMWFTLLGFAGAEATASTNATELLAGAQILAGAKLNDDYNVNVATELTYMQWDSYSVATAGGDGKAWSAGLWAWADFNEKLGVAVRGDFVKDKDGTFTSGLLGFPSNPGQDLTSLTFTLNYHPLPNVKIQPEIRYEHTSLAGGFDGQTDRVIMGVGGTYSF